MRLSHYFIAICCTLFFSNDSLAQSLLLTEDLETDDEGLNYRSNTFDDGDHDYWLRWDATNFPQGPHVKFHSAYTGFLGDYAFGGEDIDDSSNPFGNFSPGYFQLKTIDASTNQGQNIYFQVYLGGNSNQGGRYEADDYVKIEYAFDTDITTGANMVNGLPTLSNLQSGNYSTIGAFYGGVGGGSTDMFQDTDLNGAGNVGAANLTQTLQEFTFTLAVPATASNLSLRIVVLGGSSEEYVFDHIRVFGDSPLPVEWTYFLAREHHNNVFLNWQTVAEINNKGFEIQHSLNGYDWTVIDFVNGKNHTSQEVDYEYTHERPDVGLHYYRLKQIDFNGNVEYSKTISVDIKTKDKPSFSIFPNPVTNEGFLTVQLLEEISGMLSVIDFTGQQIYQTSFEKTTSFVEIPIVNLPAGLYTIQLKSNHTISVETVVIK